MFNRLRKTLAVRALPPVVQRAHGLLRDQEFAEPEEGILERFVGFWRGHPVYRESAPKPIWLPDPRAERNRETTARRAAARGEPAGPRVRTIDEGAPTMPGHVQAAYSFDASQPDMSPEARGFVAGIGVDGMPTSPVGQCETQSTVGDGATRAAGAAEIIDATAAWLTGGKRWSVRRPKK